MMPHPSPEPATEDRLQVSLVQLITEARAMMQAQGQEGVSLRTWRKVLTWLESKLPEGMSMADLDDPMLSPAANAKLRAEARLRDAAGLGPGGSMPSTAADVVAGNGIRHPEGPLLSMREEPEQV